MRNRELPALVLIATLLALALYINFAPNNLAFGKDVTPRLGLDLQGGTQVLLRAVGDTAPDTEIMQVAMGVIEQRVNGIGVAESVVQLSGRDRIIVELPGVKEPEQAIETLRGTGRLEFIDTQGQFLNPGTPVRTSSNPSPAVLQQTVPVTGTADVQPAPVEGPVFQSITDGRDLDTRQVTPRFGSSTNVTNQYAVGFAFTGDSARSLETWTSQNIQKPMCIVLDNVVFSCPVVQAALLGGSGEITTNTREDAEQIFNQLKYGALPVALSVESSRTISATLGQTSVRQSMLAGIVGLVIVAIFMITYYRLPGILATFALLLYTAISFAIYRWIPVTLTLPGIAGFILSIGLAVDANVLIFARLKDELRAGRSLRAAIEAGFNEAWPAIRDSSAATLITSTILFLFGNSFGVSLIKGFALTLGLGMILNLFTAVVVTRTLLRVVAPLRFAQDPWLYDVADLRKTARGDVQPPVRAASK